MAECCCEEEKTLSFTGKASGCMLCGKPLRYEKTARPRRCAVCGEEKLSSCACEDGHFVCDACHSAGLDAFFIPFLLQSGEKCPQTLLEQVMALPQVHMHGPEHHAIVPCVLLTAFHNCGGGNDLKEDLSVALKRGRQVPGGVCGYWGVCGAAAGAGIYMSVVPAAASAAAACVSTRRCGLPRNSSAWTCRRRRSAVPIWGKTGSASGAAARSSR